jgi:drug/metabolite transporter (DMT)-like permease
MLAILGGFGAAAAFATATLCNSRASRMIGPTTLLAWVMLLGLALVGPLAAMEGTPDGLDREAVLLLAVAALGNVAGLLLAYSGLRIGKVGVVGPVISTQGAIAAVIAVIAGEALAPGAGVLLAVIAIGSFWRPAPAKAAGDRATREPPCTRLAAPPASEPASTRRGRSARTSLWRGPCSLHAS